MTKVALLEGLRQFTDNALRDLLLPVRQQANDSSPPEPRPPTVWLMRLEKSSDAQKVSPYVIHQVITGKDVQMESQRVLSSAVVRSVCCVYCGDEQDGGLMLLNVMERLRIELLKQVVVGGQFKLDLGAGLEALVYPDDTAPYYLGEMVSSWFLPAIKREVVF